MHLGKETANRDGGGGDFLERVLLYGLIGTVVGRTGRDLALVAFGGAVVERLVGVKLEDALAEYQRQAEEAERQQRLERTRIALERALKPVPMEAVVSSLDTDLLLPRGPATIAEPDTRWRRVIIHPSVILVLGKRGSGKSALGYRLLELFRYYAKPYVVGASTSASSLLPEWIGIAPSLEDVPSKAIALVDEAHLPYHARESMAQPSKAMSQALSLSRQKEQTIIFVTQEARQVDRNIASSANVVVFKDLGILQLEFDRPELGRLAAQAKEAFATVNGDRRRWSFVYAPDTDFVGLVENNLPSFWKPSLSRLFAAGPSPSTTRTAKRMTTEERKQKAREMRAQGASLEEIRRAIGVKSRSTVQNYLKGYPYQR